MLYFLSLKNVLLTIQRTCEEKIAFFYQNHLFKNQVTKKKTCILNADTYFYQ